MTYFFNHNFSDLIYQVKYGFGSCEVEYKKHCLDYIIHSGKAKESMYKCHFKASN